MAPDKSAQLDEFDDRIAEARDSVLIHGEEIVAQETGDQGQAIVLTGLRVIIVKVGLAATGQLNGQVASVYRLGDITAVNVRKGPMGAVIQVCTQDKEKEAGGNGVPQNIVVFSGVQRAKKCEAIAAAISASLGKPVEHFQPDSRRKHAKSKNPAQESLEVVKEASTEESNEISADIGRGGRAPRSLAEEMFGEQGTSGAQGSWKQAQEQTGPTDSTASEQASSDFPAGIVSESEEVFDEEPIEFKPNPRLPMPVRRKSDLRKRTLILVAASLGLLFVGMCAMEPLKQAAGIPQHDINVTEISHNRMVATLQYNAVLDYRAKVQNIIGSQSSDGLRAAFSSGNHSAIAAAVVHNDTDRKLRDMTALQAPTGLAAAKEYLVSGLMQRVGAVGVASGGLQGGFDRGTALRKLAESDSLVKKGLAAITSMEQQLQKDSAAPVSKVKPGK